MKQPKNVRPLMVVGPVLTLFGIASSVSDSDTLGSWLTIVGLLLSITALHRFGRLGPASGRIAP